MRAAGVHRPEAAKAYFAQMGLHLANGLRVLGNVERPEVVVDLARRQIRLDPSIEVIRRHVASGRGLILAPAHTANYLLTLARLGHDLPITIYLRWSADRRKVERKRRWCQAAGIRVVLEPPNAANPTSRAAACVDIVRAGGVLAMTPDIAQKSDGGVAVSFLDGEIFLPTGPASIAMLAEAPLAPLFGRIDGDAQMLYARPPIAIPALSRAEGGRQTAVARAMQEWTDGFVEFLRASPEAWYLWGDNRWTRVFSRDSRYWREASVAAPASAPQIPVAEGLA